MKLKLRNLLSENKSLTDEVKQKQHIVDSMKKEFEQATDNAEMTNLRHQDELDQLKRLLRNKDEEITTLKDDLLENGNVIISLNQSITEKTEETRILSEDIKERNQKISDMEVSLRQSESELVALSQQHEGAMEQALVRAKDLAEYVLSLENQQKEQADMSKELNEQIEDLCDKLATNDQELADMRRNFKDKEDDYQENLYKMEERIEQLMRDERAREKKHQSELSEEKTKYQHLHKKSDHQAAEVQKLTKHLEKAINETNSHHLEQRSLLENEKKQIEEDLEEMRRKNEKLIGELKKMKKENET
jgi:chromosome segregation ATPase